MGRAPSRVAWTEADDLAFHQPHLYVVAVENFREVVAGVAQVGFQRPRQLFQLRRRRNFAPQGFNVGVDLGHLGKLAVDSLFHPVGQGVGLAQG